MQYYGLGIFSGHCMNPLIPVEQSLNAQGYLSVIADQVYSLLMVHPAGDGYFHQNNAPCNRTGGRIFLTLMPYSITKPQSN